MRKIICTFFMVLLVFSLNSCGSKKENQQELRIAFFPNVTHAQALVMKSQGILEEKLANEVKVSWVSFNAGPSEVEALFAEEIDIGYIGPVPAISAYVKSQGDVQIIAGSTNAGAVLVVAPHSDIQNITELSGKTIAIPQLGNTQHLLLLRLMGENGLVATSDGGEVKVTPSSNADVANLMERENIDAALVPEPWGSMLEETYHARVLLDYDEIWEGQDYATTVIVVRREFWEEHPEIVEEFLITHQEITDYLNQNSEEAKKEINAQLEELTHKTIEESILDKAMERLVFQTEIPSTSIMEYAEISKQNGFIEELPDEGLIIQ